MRPLQTDLSIFEKFDFEKPPLGVKFQFFKPEKVDPLPAGKSLSLCEMLAEAQNSNKPFYFDKSYQEACVGKILLGMQDMESFAESGQIGEKLQIFQEARANYAFYQHVPKFAKNIVNYVAFAPLNALAFEPDLLIITADHSQAEIVMRAMTYSTGELYASKTTPVYGCAWLFIYPFQSGKVNFIVPEMVHGMKGRELFFEGSIVISIPYHWIPTMARNLKEMTWHLPSHRSKNNILRNSEPYLETWLRKPRSHKSTHDPLADARGSEMLQMIAGGAEPRPSGSGQRNNTVLFKQQAGPAVSNAVRQHGSECKNPRSLPFFVLKTSAKGMELGVVE